MTEFGGPSVLKWEEFTELPRPGPSTARVRVLIDGITGADNIIRAGGYTRWPATKQPGFTLGFEIVGVIEELGDDSNTEFKVGDTIASLTITGGYATHAIVPLDEMLKLQPADDLVSAAALPLNYMTALGMMSKSAFPVTESTRSVLIGSVAGGVGTALAQLLKIYHPHVPILGTCSPEKFDFVQSLGVIPIDRHLPLIELPAAVKALNGGRGVDIAYEATGDNANLEAFLSATTDSEEEHGKLIAIGFLANVKADGSGVQATLFDPIQWCTERPERTSFFSVMNHYWRAQPAQFKIDFEEQLMRLVRSKKLVPAVTKFWRVEDAVEINEILATGKGLTGKHEMIVDRGVWEEYVEAASGRK